MTTAKKPPSRIKYEGNHPTVSFRVTLEEYAKLQAMRKKTGLSLGETARRVLGLRKKEIDEAFDRGLRAGYGRFDVPCKACRKPMKFDLKSEKEAEAAAAVRQAFSSWRHSTCTTGNA